MRSGTRFHPRDATDQVAVDVGLRDDLATPLAAIDSTRAGVRHTLETHDGDHSNRVAARLATSILPFFSRTLDFADGRR